ncbi:hypothetical protein O9929_16960 [Vibrio lentus]|nr:hypothetical protein [Vibrio lentus]
MDGSIACVIMGMTFGRLKAHVMFRDPADYENSAEAAAIAVTIEESTGSGSWIGDQVCRKLCSRHQINQFISRRVHQKKRKTRALGFLNTSIHSECQDDT